MPSAVFGEEPDNQRQQVLLPVGYYHLVFSVPHALVSLTWQNKRRLFSLLFDRCAATLLEVVADPRHLGRRDRVPLHPPHLGTDPAATSPYPLRRARGFPRIRYFGWLANRRRKDLLPLCRLLLRQGPDRSRASLDPLPGKF